MRGGAGVGARLRGRMTGGREGERAGTRGGAAARAPGRHPAILAALAAGLVLLTGGCALPHWPAHGPMTSAFGLRLVGWSPEVHRGVDIAVDDGTPVLAMESGTVVFAGNQSGYGLTVILHHHGSTRSLYGHLSALRVKPGDKVRGGQVIALSGHSGNARGPHLHFEVQRWGEAEDPVPLLGRRP